jgi:hypothetical protein
VYSLLGGGPTLEEKLKQHSSIMGQGTLSAKVHQCMLTSFSHMGFCGSSLAQEGLIQESLGAVPNMSPKMVLNVYANNPPAAHEIVRENVRENVCEFFPNRKTIKINSGTFSRTFSRTFSWAAGRLFAYIFGTIFGDMFVSTLGGS